MEQVAEAKTEVATERKVRAMEPTRLRGGDFIRTIYCATAFEATTPEDLLKPEYWAHVAQQFKPWDRVEVTADDGTWWAELQVMETGRGWTRMFLMRQHSLTTKDVAQSQTGVLAAYEVKYRGPHRKWSVVRLSDNEPLHEGEETRDGADLWLKGHLTAMAR